MVYAMHILLGTAALCISTSAYMLFETLAGRINAQCGISFYLIKKRGRLVSLR